jgi:LuxR family maltose regulon positive regulatory protein
VAGVADSQEFLERLEQSNLFIVPIDQSRKWYRYHRLFAELLHYRLEMSGLDVSELHEKASLWHERNGFVSEAVGHALSAQDWERAGKLILSVNEDYLKRGEVLTLIHWFQSLPEKIILSNPKLCFEYCWPLLLTTQYEKAGPLLEHVEQAAQAHPVFLGEVYAAQAYLARGQGEHQRMVERSQAALKLLPKSSITSRGLVSVNLGIAYWHMGQMQSAELALEEALEAGQATQNHYAILTALIFLGRVLAVRGQFQQACGYFERAIQYGDQIPINALAHMDLATLHYEWNALDVSDAHLQKAIAICQRTQNYEFLVGALMIQSRLRIAQGNFAGVRAALEQAWDLVNAEKIPTLTAERLNVAQIRLLIAKGEPTGEWVEKLTEKVDCHPFYRFLGLTKAWILPAPHARAYLDGLGQAAQANEWHYGMVAVRTVQAVLAEKQDLGLDFLLDALKLAEDSGYIRTFVEAGEKLIPLLRIAAAQGLHSEYAARILSTMGDLDDARMTDHEALIEPLSPRELEVLQLVTAGRSNREIAAALVISTGTAKTHVHNLCGKLGVRNRTEAATKAIQLGLV